MHGTDTAFGLGRKAISPAKPGAAACRFSAVAPSRAATPALPRRLSASSPGLRP